VSRGRHLENETKTFAAANAKGFMAVQPDRTADRTLPRTACKRTACFSLYTSKRSGQALVPASTKIILD